MKERLTDFGLLWLRVLAGAGFMYHGWQKIAVVGVERFAEKGVEPLGFLYPLIFAWLAVASELIGGFFLVLGLWTRVSAAFLVGTMSVAAFGAHAGDPFSKRELSLVYLTLAGAILMLGPGKFAVRPGQRTGRVGNTKKSRK